MGYPVEPLGFKTLYDSDYKCWIYMYYHKYIIQQTQ